MYIGMYKYLNVYTLGYSTCPKILKLYNCQIYSPECLVIIICNCYHRKKNKFQSIHHFWLTFSRVVNHTTVSTVKWHYNNVPICVNNMKKIEYIKRTQRNPTISFIEQFTGRMWGAPCVLIVQKTTHTYNQYGFSFFFFFFNSQKLTWLSL